MIDVHIKLYGGLRDKISAEKKGRTTLTLPANSTVQTAIDTIGIKRPVLVAVNEAHESAATYALSDGDKLAIFEFTAGG